MKGGRVIWPEEIGLTTLIVKEDCSGTSPLRSRMSDIVTDRSHLSLTELILMKGVHLVRGGEGRYE